MTVWGSYKGLSFYIEFGNFIGFQLIPIVVKLHLTQI